ncbi:MAG: PQQ-binding-like beta-propeller repeat protein, partial [Planctomycetales bacterium]|nr:PQQ-binding-like beta-propeller repeat protein [Planctomycetales bacterium]
RMASMSALVSARGRIFYIMDEGSRVSIQLPPRWTLLARDAFNGTILWRQPIPEWQNHLWPLKSGPTQLARRLVAVDDRVFVTLGFHAPVTMIDARTGETRRVFEATAGTEELLVNNGLLLAQVNRGAMETDDYAPALNVGDQGRVAREYAWNQKPREIMAIDIETGETLWSRETTMAPLTMTLDEQRAYFHDGQKVVCLDRKTGDQLWTSEPAARRQTITMNFGPKLVVYKSVVLFAGGDRTMKAFDSATGKHLWTAPHAQSGYQSPEDLLVANGLVWSAPTTRTQDSGIYSGLDPLTGEVKVEFPPAVDTYWFHHRCYIAKGTDRFIMPSRTGVEFVDTLTQKWDIHHWVRGGCLYGVMPANGLVYAPPHNCACYPEAKLYGFNALAAANEDRLPPAPEDIDNESRLQRGPAYNEPLAPLDDEARLADWPTYRHDNARSGSSPSEGPAALDAAWQTELGGRLSAVTVADGRLYVSQVDAHTLHALDAISGDKLWRFTAGGRIDSPPTIHQGRVLFGSADGYVYSLRATDGALVWRFRGAPTDRRLMAMEQLESVWPVHGSVLIEDGVASFIAGRSNFLDGGMRLIRLDAVSGQKLSETVLDDRDPDTGENLQTRLQVLQMPVGLSDILTSDGESIYLRSQMFDREGNRLKMGPHSGQAERHGGTQKGEGRHLFAPTGFLDDTWFHRSYWVYGRSFAGGHNGYYQAGRFTPSGRMLVFNDEYVFGFARKPQYYRWTTIMEHELFRSSKEAADEAYGDSENPTEDAPTTPRPGATRGGATGRQSNANAGGRQANNQANNPRPNNGQSGNNNGRQRGNKATADSIHFGVLPKLDPTGKPLTVELWVNAEQPAGVLLAHGGPQNGYALVMRGGKAGFDIRAENQLTSITSSDRIVGRWAHVVGVLDEQKQMRLYVDG